MEISACVLQLYLTLFNKPLNYGHIRSESISLSSKSTIPSKIAFYFPSQTHPMILLRLNT